MGLFTKKQPKEKIVKKVKRVAYGPAQPFDIKVILVNLTFADGRIFTTRVYGTFSQYVFPAYSSKYDDVCLEPHVSSALRMAEQFIFRFNDHDTYVDDPKNPRHSIIGKVVSALIDTTLGEQSYIEQHSVATLVETEIEI